MTTRIHATFSVVSSVVVAAAVVWGAVLVGSPGTARVLRFDQQRLEDLQTIFREVQSLCHDPDMKDELKRALPATLDELAAIARNERINLTDPETGHLRGLYGDTDLWNQTAFMQGGDQDIYIVTWPLNLTVEETDQTIVCSFRVGDSWFYEDFDNNQKFNPCDNTSDACGGGAEWSPLFPAVSISAQ